MTDIAIRCEGLGKQYRIGERERYKALRDTITDTLSAPFRRLRAIRNPQSAIRNPEFWALKDISFEVKRGEVVGIIGRNGAGKSTLLKILSRITAPSAGEVEIRGRVGSLLEVGTGFHPELTGRENIYLNGAILGMKKAEIERKFDEIVAFAEVERFIDTPVKRYSSGMYVRLAFAVAAHLEPEILVVDEVLAVGDTAFQKKCLGKMGDVAKQGRTILLVSHNMTAVKRICHRALVLSNGTIFMDGDADESVQAYLSEKDIKQSCAFAGLHFESVKHDPHAKFEVNNVRVLDKQGKIKSTLRSGDYARFRIEWDAAEIIANGGVELGIHTLDGIPLIQYSTKPVSNVEIQFHIGRNCIDCEFDHFPLAAGQYRLSVALTRPMMEWLYRDDEFGILHVEEQDLFDSGTPVLASRALLAVQHRWSGVNKEII